MEVDELWGFVGCNERSRAEGKIGHGDAWVWVAIDADSKLCVSYLVGKRDQENATDFVRDVAGRLRERIQLTSDGHSAYPATVEAAFGGAVDYSMLVKTYESERAGEARYSPPKCTGCDKRPMVGNPDREMISTSYVERSNLTTRMSARRFTRLTSGYSRLLSNRVYAVALHFLAYNFIMKHTTLKTTPDVAAGLAARPMTMLDFVDLLEREVPIRGGRLSDYQPATVRAEREVSARGPLPRSRGWPSVR